MRIDEGSPMRVQETVRQRRSHRVLLLGALAVVVLAAGCNLRTGWHHDQPDLHPSKVNTQDFGQLFDAPVTGQIYAQPVIHDGVVVAATE